MTGDEFVSRLERVKRTGRGTWLARCPGHEDRTPSLTVREVEDGRILLHCFAGCDVAAITGALGVELHDLFPAEPIEYAKPLRRPFPAADVLEALQFELEVIAICAGDLAAGRALSEQDAARMKLARERFKNARSLALEH